MVRKKCHFQARLQSSEKQLSVRLSAWNNSAPTESFKKFDDMIYLTAIG
jgi:hypothetical protein